MAEVAWFSTLSHKSADSKETVYVIPFGYSLAIIRHFVFGALPYLDWIVWYRETEFESPTGMMVA